MREWRSDHISPAMLHSPVFSQLQGLAMALVPITYNLASMPHQVVTSQVNITCSWRQTDATFTWWLYRQIRVVFSGSPVWFEWMLVSKSVSQAVQTEKNLVITVTGSVAMKFGFRSSFGWIGDALGLYLHLVPSSDYYFVKFLQN